MRRTLRLSLAAASLAACALASRASAQRPADGYRAAADSLIRNAQKDSFAYARLAELTDRFGARFSGTPNLERAIDWIVEKMRADGLANVHTEPVMVPHWVRGAESAELVAPRPMRLHLLGLGGSIGTPPQGLEAEVLVVTSFDDLRRRGAEARGRIVLFDVPFTSYGETVRYRGSGAFEAAKLGAVAALIRSVGPFGMQTPHTGSIRRDSATTIPAAALSMEDAMLLHRFQDRGERVRVKLVMGARTLPDVPSRNVVAELRGRERPDEVVVIGGHIDSWDVGAGAMDDGGGSVAAWEAVRLMQRLGLRPRRTVRVVLWTNEENGLRGGTAYRDQHAGELDRHVFAIESDLGTFAPRGFSFGGTDAAYDRIAREVMPLLAATGADTLTKDGGAADIGPIMARGVPGMELLVDETRYFWYHHTEADTIDKLDPAELARCVAAMAVAAYVTAEMPEPLPRTPAAR